MKFSIHDIAIFLLIALGSCTTLEGQEYEFRFYVGANYYQGDLSPRNTAISFSPGRLGLATMFGTRLNNTFRLNVKFMMGQIGGDDADSFIESRRIRNLQFDSPLYEAGINTEVHINSFIKSLDKYGIDVYYTTGINVFHFSPKATYRQISGKYVLIDLQPLGTEGQGLPGFDDPYRLTQINIPFGMGFKFQLIDNIEFGFEFVPRKTFTDYLDDVSGSYVNYNEMVAANRSLAAQLANRTGEFLGTGPVLVPTGTMRGNPSKNDWYFFGSCFFSYNFGKGYVAKKLIQAEIQENKDNMSSPPDAQ